MSICKVCNRDLPLSKFKTTKYTSKTTGEVHVYHDTTCMACRRKKHVSKPEKKEQARVSSREWYYNNPEKAKSQRLRRYGIDLDQYNLLREKQQYRCAICNKHETEVSQGRATKPEHALHVDHCHTDGHVRGLLCTNCNTILGKCYDDPKILLDAMLYLYTTGKDNS